jgi:hypothetical protein
MAMSARRTESGSVRTTPELVYQRAPRQPTTRNPPCARAITTEHVGALSANSRSKEARLRAPYPVSGRRTSMKNPKKNKSEKRERLPEKPLTSRQPHRRSLTCVADVRLAVGINSGHAGQPRGVGKTSRAMEGQRTDGQGVRPRARAQSPELGVLEVATWSSGGDVVEGGPCKARTAEASSTCRACGLR